MLREIAQKLDKQSMAHDDIVRLLAISPSELNDLMRQWVSHNQGTQPGHGA